jgi:hypothetical protein
MQSMYFKVHNISQMNDCESLTRNTHNHATCLCRAYSLQNNHFEAAFTRHRQNFLCLPVFPEHCLYQLQVMWQWNVGEALGRGPFGGGAQRTLPPPP